MVCACIFSQWGTISSEHDNCTYINRKAHSNIELTDIQAIAGLYAQLPSAEFRFQVFRLADENGTLRRYTPVKIIVQIN